MVTQTFVPQPVVQSSSVYIGATAVCDRLKSAGHEAYVVGGCVRDFFLDPASPPKDIDIATSATPNEVIQLFPGSDFVGKAFGVCLVKHMSHAFEVTTFRKEGQYTDRRHPDFIEQGSLLDDSCRRDFTINALYFDPVETKIHDLHGGLEHLQKRVLSCVGQPRQRLYEDSLRIVRMFRFASNFNLEIENSTLDAAKEEASGLSLLSRERIVTEFVKVRFACFSKFAEEFLSNIALSNIDSRFERVVLNNENKMGFQSPDAHKQLPIALFANEIAKRAKDPAVTLPLLATGFESWPMAMADKSALLYFTRQLPTLALKASGDFHLFYFYFFKSVSKQKSLTGNTLGELSQRGGVPFLELADALMSHVGEDSIDDFLVKNKKNLSQSTESIVEKVTSIGKHISLAGAAVALQDSENFYRALGFETKIAFPQNFEERLVLCEKLLASRKILDVRS